MSGGGDSGAGFNPFASSSSSASAVPAPSSAAALAASLLRPLPGQARQTIQSAPVLPSSTSASAAAANPFGADGASSRSAALNGGLASSTSPSLGPSAGPSHHSSSPAAMIPSHYPPLGAGPSFDVDVYPGDACPVALPVLLPPPSSSSSASSSSSSSSSPGGAGVDGRLGITPPSHIKGETPIFRDIECYYRPSASFPNQRLMGSLSATTYSVTFNWYSGPSNSANSPLLPQAPCGLRHIHSSFFTAPVTFIRKIEKFTPRGNQAGSLFTVEIAFKDVRSWTLVFSSESLADKVVGHLRMVAFPAKVDFLHCFEEAKAIGLSQGVFNLPPAGLDASPIPTTLTTPGNVLPGWEVYNPYQELERLGVLGLRNPRTGGNVWRVSDINREYRFCPTYPSVLVFPERVPDQALRPLESFRSKARVPALTWQHPSNKSTLWRCSQPRVGMGNNACREDELLFFAIKEATSLFFHQSSRGQAAGGAAVAAAAAAAGNSGGGVGVGGGGGGGGDSAPLLLIADCRPKANAMANKAGGWGYENYPGFSQLEFLGIHNIHAVRDSYRKLEALATGSAGGNDISWTSAVADSGWLHHVRSILGGALFVAESMHRRGQSVVVHCSDGWDRTAQVCGLVQLLLDPYSRTLRGLCSLIAKEWCSFGHKFHQRCGHGDEKADIDGDFSPVFIQFLDAVWQLVRLFPFAFEFNERTLLVIGHHLYSCRFGTFLFNCERERAESRLPYRAQSLWAYLLHGGPARTAALVNPSYNPSLGDVLMPHPSAVLRSVEVWSEWFLRWSPFPSMLPPRPAPPAPTSTSTSPSSDASWSWWSACCRLEKYPPHSYDHARVAEVAVVSRAWDGWRKNVAAAAAALVSGAGGAAAVPAASSSASSSSSSSSVGAARAVRPSVTRDPLTGAVIAAADDDEVPPQQQQPPPPQQAPSVVVPAGFLSSPLSSSSSSAPAVALDDGSGDETPSSPAARAGAGKDLVEGVAAVLLSEGEGRREEGRAADEGDEGDEAEAEAMTPAVTAAMMSQQAGELNEEDEGADDDDEDVMSPRTRRKEDEEDGGDTRGTNSPAPPSAAAGVSSGGYADDD